MARWLLPLSRPCVAAAALAVAGTVSVYGDSSQPARDLINLLVPAVMGDTSKTASSDAQAENMARLKAWLVQQGADISHIDLRASRVGQDDCHAQNSTYMPLIMHAPHITVDMRTATNTGWP